MSNEIVFNRAAQLEYFLRAFEKRGGHPAAVLKTAGMEMLDLSDATTLITGPALYRAVEAMAENLADPFFSARTAKDFVESGPLFVRDSYAASHTLAEFLPLAILEIGNQINDIRFSLHIEQDVTVIRGKRNFLPPVPIVQADAAAVSLWVTLLRMVVSGDFDVSRVLLTVQETKGIPPDMAPRSSCLKQAWNGVSIGFPSEWLRKPLDLGWSFKPTPRGEFSGHSTREAVHAYVHKVCLERLSDKSFGIDEFASLLGVHPRTLQRTFAEMGTSFQKLRENARREQALELLSASKNMAIDEVAEALGFSSSTSFSRAFKRWTGVSPAVYRGNP